MKRNKSWYMRRQGVSVAEPNTTVTTFFLDSIVEQVHNDEGEPRN
jgi:hypothetical protein